MTPKSQSLLRQRLSQDMEMSTGGQTVSTSLNRFFVSDYLRTYWNGALFVLFFHRLNRFFVSDYLRTWPTRSVYNEVSGSQSLLRQRLSQDRSYDDPVRGYNITSQSLLRQRLSQDIGRSFSIRGDPPGLNRFFVSDYLRTCRRASQRYTVGLVSIASSSATISGRSGVPTAATCRSSVSIASSSATISGRP